MSLKVLFVLSLVAAASANPTPTFGLIPVFGDIVHIGASGIGHTIGTLFKTVSGVEHVAENIITDLFNIKVRAFTDVINLGVKVTLGLADVVDASISGLGNLIARIVGATIKIVMCFLGGAGDATVCSDNWNIQFGVSATTAVDARALIRLYGLRDCYSRVQSIIRVITREGGIAVVNGSIRVILQVALDLASLVNGVINGTYRLAKADLTLIFRKIAIILGAIGNSHQNGSGLKILNNFIPTCNKYFISAGYPSFGNWKDVEVIIDLGNGDNAPWALTAIDGSASTAVSVDTAIGGLIGNVLKGVIGVTRLASNVIQDILGLVINTFDDVITLAVKIVLGLGGLLDSTIAGLGSLLVRIVAALIQIVLCFLGDSGKYGVCRPGWGRQFGVNSDASSIETVISLYGLTNCKAAVNKYIYTYTKGKGISSVSGSTLILLQSTVTLSEYVDAGKFDRSILVKVFQQLAYLLGAVGNSNARGVGTRVCNKFIPTCNKFLAAEGYSGLGNNLQAIIKVIERANDDEYLWSADVGGYIKGSGFVVGTGVSRTTGVVGTIGGIIGGLLGGVFQVVEGVTKLASNILTDIFSIKIRAITDVFNLIVKLALGLGGVIDSTVAGLGSLLARVVAVILKIGICVNGLPGDRSICENGWNAQFGVYGESNTQSGLIELFNVGNAQYDLDIYINKLTNNKGIESTSGSLRIILERCRIAASYVSVSKQITKQSITDVFVILTTISAAISNSNKENSGKQIVNQVITTCGPYLRDHGYPDVTVQVTVVIRVIASANNDSINWTGGNTGNTGDNTGNIGDNTGNTGDNTGNTEDNTGNTGDNSGYTGDNTGNTGDHSGNTGDHSGNTGDSTGDTGDHSGSTEDSTGDTGDHSGNTGDHSGNTGDHSGNTGDHSGNTGDHSGNTGDSTGDTGDHSGNTGDHSENTGDHSGNTSDHSGNTGDHSGNTGDSTGDTGDHSGNTGEHSGNTGDHSENTCDHSENTGDHSGNTGDHSGNTGDSTVNTGDHSGNTGDSTGYTGDHSGNTGDSTGDTGDHSGNTGDHSGNTGDNTGNTGDSSGSDTGKNNGNMGGNTSGGSVTIGGGVSFDFGGFIGGIFKGLTGVTKLVSNIIKQIISIKINAFVDVLNLAFKVSLGIGGVINSVIVGLGSILARIIAVIFKIGICVNGFTGDRNICTKTWNAQFGIDGDATTADDLIAIFGLQNCRADVDKIISVYTNGKGISSIENGSIRIVFENVVTLVTVVSGGVSKQDVSASWSRLFIIVGAVLNASNKGSGTELTQKIVPACNQYFVRQGYPALISAEQIIAIISEANNHRWQADTVSHQTVIAQGDVLVEKIKNLFQTVKDKNNLQNTSVTAILNLDVPNSFDGVLVFVVKIVRALGAILDIFIKGLGSFLVRMVAFLLRYTACVLGAARNSKCYICQNAFYKSLGVAVKGNTYADIAAAFNVENAKAELDAILAAYTDKGRASLAGSVKIAFDQAYALVALVSKPRIEEADLSLTLNSCAKLFGGFANSCSPGLGKQICSGMLPVCSTFLQQNQYPALDSASISAAIAVGNGDAAPWARSAVATTN